MAGYTSLAAICVMACMTMFHAQALIPEDAEAPGAWTLMPEDAGALGAWAPANSPSAALSGDASASTVASGTIPRAYQTGVRTPNTPKVPPITWTGLANAAEYKAQVRGCQQIARIRRCCSLPHAMPAQVHAAAGALNLVPINSLGTVDVSRAREMTFVNLGTKTIWVRTFHSMSVKPFAAPLLLFVFRVRTYIRLLCHCILFFNRCGSALQSAAGCNT